MTVFPRIVRRRSESVIPPDDDASPFAAGFFPSSEVVPTWDHHSRALLPSLMPLSQHGKRKTEDEIPMSEANPLKSLKLMPQMGKEWGTVSTPLKVIGNYGLFCKPPIQGTMRNGEPEQNYMDADDDLHEMWRKLPKSVREMAARITVWP